MTRVLDHHTRLIDEVEHLVAALRARPETQADFSVAEVAQMLGLRSPRAYGIVRRLDEEGRIVLSTPQAGTQPGRWRLVDAPAPDRAARTAADNMWTPIRKLPSFTVTSVLAHAHVGNAAVTERSVRNYVRALMAAGYLRVLEKARPGREAVYRLKPGHGVRAPRLCRVPAIVDPNTDTTTVIGGPGT